MNDKAALVRRHILDRLENETLRAGDKLPGARVIAQETGISFLKVQQGLDSLAKDGVLRIRSRAGTVVQEDWRTRALPENLSLFNEFHRLPWLEGLLPALGEKMPELRLSHAFPRGMLEIKTTLHVQQHCAEYADLSGLLEECYPDRDAFFRKPFESFYHEGRLVGVPFIFSPRVMFYNPQLLEDLLCEQPHPDWEWADFLRTVKKLQMRLPSRQIFNLHYRPHLWINFVMRAGGRLIDPQAADPVQIDSPQTRAGLRLFSELAGLLRFSEPYNGDEYLRQFCKSEAAFLLADRQLCCRLRHCNYDGWATVPLPRLPGGINVSTQSTDLLCVRRDCADPDLACRFLKLMLSPQVQDYIADERYGIPVRKSSAFRSIDLSDPRDALFAAEMANIRADYNLYEPHLAGLVTSGIQRLLEAGADVEAATAELAQMARTYLQVQQYRAGQAV